MFFPRSTPRLSSRATRRDHFLRFSAFVYSESSARVSDCVHSLHFVVDFRTAPNQCLSASARALRIVYLMMDDSPSAENDTAKLFGLILLFIYGWCFWGFTARRMINRSMAYARLSHCTHALDAQFPTFNRQSLSCFGRETSCRGSSSSRLQMPEIPILSYRYHVNRHAMPSSVNI